MPAEDEDVFLEFYLPENNSWWGDLGNHEAKKLISPLQEDAFSEQVLHEVANQQLGFFIPYETWEMINEAFSYYWDEFVGLGGLISNDEMFLCIRQQLIERNVLFPDDSLQEIVYAIYDFIERIPGALLPV
jgi:hypothetical protein